MILIGYGTGHLVVECALVQDRVRNTPTVDDPPKLLERRITFVGFLAVADPDKACMTRDEWMAPRLRHRQNLLTGLVRDGVDVDQHSTAGHRVDEELPVTRQTFTIAAPAHNLVPRLPQSDPGTGNFMSARRLSPFATDRKEVPAQ